ncbi:hypothetical protein ES703_123409 [subsurface metagenome]
MEPDTPVITSPPRIKPTGRMIAIVWVIRLPTIVRVSMILLGVIIVSFLVKERTNINPEA